MKKRKINAPGFLILCDGGAGDKAHGAGVVIARGRETVDFMNVVSRNSAKNGKWYIAQTNMDVWTHKDHRYDLAIQNLDAVGQSGASTKNLVENVLRVKGVKTSLTIFAAAMIPS